MNSIRAWFQKNPIWTHSQNLNEDSRGRAKGSMFWHGRAWLYVPNIFSKAKREIERSLTFGVEWSWRKHIRSAGVSFWAHDDRVTLSFDVAFFAVYFSLTGLFYSQNWRNTGVQWLGDFILLDFWHDDNGWAKNWKGIHISIQPLNILLGRRKYTTRDLETVRAFIPLPEGAYPATIRFFESTWKRPRWFAEKLIRADIKPDKPLPIPGKGENSWDCDDDAIWGGTYPASNVTQAVLAIVESVLETRARYGWNQRDVQLAPAITGIVAHGDA